MTRRSFIGFLATALVAASVVGSVSDRADALPTVSHVVHVSVDGLTVFVLADLMENDPAATAAFHRLVDEGASTFDARTDATHTRTLPNHASMLTGRPVDAVTGLADTTNLGYVDNDTPAPGVTLHNGGNPALDYVPSVFDVVHDNGLSTALYASKTKFSLFDVSFDATHGAADTTGADDGADRSMWR